MRTVSFVCRALIDTFELIKNEVNPGCVFVEKLLVRQLKSMLSNGAARTELASNIPHRIKRVFISRNVRMLDERAAAASQI